MQLVHQYIWILWDLIAVFVFFHCVRTCVRKGFLSTIVGLLIYVVAAFAASYAYKQLANFIYDNVVETAVEHVLTRSFNDMLTGIGSASKDVLHSMPFGLRFLVGFKGKDIASLSGTDANGLANQVIDMALQDPLMSILHGISFLLIFTIMAYIMRSIARLIRGVNHVPVIGTINSVLGGIVGIIGGVITLLVGGFILRIAIALSAEAWWWLNTNVLNSTYIWSRFL